MITLPVAEALAYTEALSLEGVEETTAFIWKSSETTAALGISQKAEIELNMKNIQANNIPVVRRQSGGGAVILGSGTLCFEVIAPITNTTADLNIKESFQEYTAPLVNLLNSRGIPAQMSGVSDISVSINDESKKVAGCAQLRKKRALVVHASILVDIDKTLLENYLQFPSDVPDYRNNRTHTDFCLNLSELAPNLTTEIIELELLAEFTRLGWKIIKDKPTFNTLATQLLEKKYSQNSWNIDRQRPRIF